MRAITACCLVAFSQKIANSALNLECSREILPACREFLDGLWGWVSLTPWDGPGFCLDSRQLADMDRGPLIARDDHLVAFHSGGRVTNGGAFCGGVLVAWVVVLFPATICAAFGAEAGVEALAYLDNGQFVFTRTDQPALPGETVQERMKTECQITTHPVINPTEQLIGNEWNQLFFVSLWLGGNGLGNADSFGPPAFDRGGQCGCNSLRPCPQISLAFMPEGLPMRKFLGHPDRAV